MNEKNSSARATVITEEDLAAIDVQGVLNEPLRATDPINKIFLVIGTAMAVIATIGIGGLMLINVALRYIWGSSLPVATEGPSYFFGWLIAAGAIIAQAQLGHVAVDLVPSLLRPRARKALLVAIWVASTLLLAYGAYLGLYLSGVLSDQKTLVMEWPVLGSFAAFIVMMLVMAVQALIRTILLLREPAGAISGQSADSVLTGGVGTAASADPDSNRRPHVDDSRDDSGSDEKGARDV
ncbi:TRAP transporter small permease subunit [Brevibacterium sp.]|uniref:TRAP transporter small permease n=1 Tax=Brevibacterium sp. TaxID=1701 RepID=UPI002811A8D2|nr:TRAP transporter small permease subunit [Brevibacterium sp.]